MKVRRSGRSGSSTSRSTELVPGQQVRGRVIARLGGGYFRIGAAGQLFNAWSDLSLKPGQHLTAKVEVGESKVILRLKEDKEGKKSNILESINRTEIKRILQGLGYNPGHLELIEFEERLDRYRIHASLPGVEPSDIWVMAILWTRGIKGGADAFALLSYYLRYSGVFSESAPSLPEPNKLPSFLEFARSANPIPAEIGAETSRRKPSQDSEEFWIDRKQEARELLNRGEGNAGKFQSSSLPSDNACSITYKKDSLLLLRWSDHPSFPQLLLSAGRSQDRVKVHICKLGDQQVDQNVTDSWIKEVEAELTSRELELEEIKITIVEDSERQRFLLWHKWEPDRFRNLLA